MNIAKSVSEALHNSRKTQTWLAAELGCTTAYINAVYSGDKIPSANKLFQIAQKFNLKLSEFIALGE
jgi:transcriptional regulator with XRE-family HTH domain